MANPQDKTSLEASIETLNRSSERVGYWQAIVDVHKALRSIDIPPKVSMEITEAIGKLEPAKAG